MEIRSTKPGFLDDLHLDYGEPAPTEKKFDGVFSVIVDIEQDRGKRMRRIPIFYLSVDPFFSHRDLNRLKAVVSKTVTLATAVPDSATYVAQACRIGEVRGLYARDLWNRAPFRRRLARLGFEFSSDPLVQLTEEGSFASSDTQPFVPSFIVLGGVDEEDALRVLAISQGLAVWTLAKFRFGSIGPDELMRLADACRVSRVVASGDPGALAESLRT